MIRNPNSLRDLMKNADDGYAMTIFSETKFSEDDVMKKKVGGFKKKNDYLYVWWHRDKWVAVDGKLEELSKYFIVDEIGYQDLTGEVFDDTARKRHRLPREVDSAKDIFFKRRWTPTEHASHRFNVKVYLNTQKKNHAQEIYQVLQDFLIDDGVEVVAPEFTTGKLSTIADMIAVRAGQIEVFEIKSKADTFKRLESQLTDYRSYADKVWVVLDANLTSKFKTWGDEHPELILGLGVITYTKGELSVVQQAKVNFPDLSYLELLWQIELEKVLIGLDLPHSSTTKDGTRRERVEKICLYTKPRMQSIGKRILMSRIAKFYAGKHPNQPGMTVADCAGTIPYYELRTIVFGKSSEEQHQLEHGQDLSGCVV